MALHDFLSPFLLEFSLVLLVPLLAFWVVTAFPFFQEFLDPEGRDPVIARES